MAITHCMGCEVRIYTRHACLTGENGVGMFFAPRRVMQKPFSEVVHARVRPAIAGVCPEVIDRSFAGP